MVHQVDEAPESSFFILNIDQQKSYNIVQALYVAYFFIKVGVCFADIKQFVIAAVGFLAPQL